MKMMIRLGPVPASEVGEEVARKLDAILPPTGVMYLPTDDPRVAQALFILERAGCKPWMPADGKYPSPPNEFLVAYERVYEEGDFIGSQFVEVHPDYLFKDSAPRQLGGGRTALEAGRLLELGVTHLSNSCDCAFTEAGYYGFVVPDRVRRLLEGGGLGGISFRDTVPLVPGGLAGRPVPWSEVGEPWWELTSTLVMPPVSPTMDLRDPDTRQRMSPGETANGCYRYDGLYRPVELHYRVQDVQSMSPFDLAHTAESFSGRARPDPLQRSLVASKRFYDFCRENSLQIGWVPVRIEP